MSRTAVIDYDAGNTSSVIKALEYLGQDVVLSSDPAVLSDSDRIILPGVGAFYDAMNKLRERELVGTVKDLISQGMPFLGICLGMQLLFENSEETIGLEDPGVKTVEGLAVLPGTIRHFVLPEDMKIPHMGWNSLDITQSGASELFKGIENGSFVYFVHSYYLNAADRSDVASTTEYGITFDSAVAHGRVFGCQFHPEKSGETGLKILRNFCELK